MGVCVGGGGVDAFYLFFVTREQQLGGNRWKKQVYLLFVVKGREVYKRRN